MSGARSLAKAAAIGAAAALLGTLLLGRGGGATTLRGTIEGEGRILVLAARDDCGGGGPGLILASAAAGPGPFALEVPDEGPGIAYACAWRVDAGQVVAAARQALGGRREGIALRLRPVAPFPLPRGLSP